MSKPPRIVVAGLAVVVLGGLAWFAYTRLAKVPGHGAPLHSLEFNGVSADYGRSTNLIAVGDWSKPVKDAAGYILRGRLLVFDTPHFTNQYPSANPTEWWGNAPVYLELQNLSPRNDQALAVYSDLQDGLECELRDARGTSLVPTSIGFFSGSTMPFELQSWTSVPFGGSVRLRADPQLGGFSPKPNGLVIRFGFANRWIIPAGGSESYYLSGNFSPPTNHPSPPGAHVWSGTLELPPVRIPSPKP